MDNILSWISNFLNLPRSNLVSPLPQSGLQARNIKPIQSMPSAGDFQKGFANYGQNVPIATASAQLAQGAQSLPSTIDPYLAAVIAIMESQGGLKQVGVNNPFNLRGLQNNRTQFINYPDLTTAILGGNNQGVQSKGFYGQILQNPSYEPFRKSGDLADFFKVYTPPGPEYGNPSLEDLLGRYSSIRQKF